MLADEGDRAVVMQRDDRCGARVTKDLERDALAVRQGDGLQAKTSYTATVDLAAFNPDRGDIRGRCL